jgi:hypothetical protein
LRLWGTGTTAESSTTKAGANSSSDKENTTGKHQGKRKSKTKAEKKAAAAAAAAAATDTKASAPPPAATPPAPKSAPVEMPVPTSKCCALCQKERTLDPKSDNADGDDDNKKTTENVILPCGHIFCVGCCGSSYLPDPTSTVQARSCAVCGKLDAGVGALQALPYIIDLRDPPEALLESLYKEHSMIVMCESIEALEKQHQKELDTLDAQKSKAIKAKKEEINKTTKDNKDKKGKLMKQMTAR